jgi:serine/alanine adding enzyme
VLPLSFTTRVVSEDIFDMCLDPSTDPWIFGRLESHPSAWLGILSEGLGHQQYLIIAETQTGQLVGFLPLAFVQSLLFGKFLVSLPYLNSGGVCSRTPEVALALIDRAVDLADQLDVRYLELRHEVPVNHPKLSVSRTDKVHMRLELPASADELVGSFKSKLRSQIKKSSQQQFELSFGGMECLEDFYDVFSINMRDLGTPVYSKKLFQSILEKFGPSKSELCVVRWNNRPISGALLIHHTHRTEVPSASGIRKFNFTNVNMWMYWQLLQRAIEQGSTEFDFGRSTIGAGTYKFKEQWGAKPSPAVWQYYVRKGDPAKMRPDTSKNQRLVEIWKKLPVWLTRMVGPSIVRGIP